MLNTNKLSRFPRMVAYVLVGLALSPLSNIMAQTASSTATTTGSSVTSTSTGTTDSTSTSSSASTGGATTSTGNTSNQTSVYPIVTTSIPVYATISTPVTVINFLSIGSRGADVTTLQSFLAQDPSIYPQGLVTGYYGPLTAGAVRRFQAKYGIDIVGVVGPITRQKVNELILSGGFGSGTGTVSSGSAPSIFNVTTTPLVNQDGTKAMTFSWTTDRPTIGRVFYSTAPLVFTETNSPKAQPVIVGGASVADNSLTTTKTLSVSDLNGSTTYYYMIEAVDANGYVSVTWPNTSQTR